MQALAFRKRLEVYIHERNVSRVVYIIFSSPHRKSPMHTLITALSSAVDIDSSMDYIISNYSVFQSTALLLAPISEQGLASSTFYLGLDIGMALGPILSGFIDSILPIQYFYSVEFIFIPFLIIVYVIYKKRLNAAIDNH